MSSLQHQASCEACGSATDIESEMLDQSSSHGELLDLTFVTMTGTRTTATGVPASSTLMELRARAEAELGISDDCHAKLCLDGRAFDQADLDQSLTDLNISDGAELLCVMQKAIFQVEDGLKVLVSGAGTETVNGIYTYNAVLKTFVHGDNKRLNIYWYPANSWPAAWYISEGIWGVYVQASYSASCLPVAEWQIYEGSSSSPGLAPPPTIELQTD
mmetsp:Transcript_133710/g.231372  ORF Transcript_133710/g.231372 Transcript_133710/m.231372 type:complete len:216 (+) Transcript_133710:63-710(+)